MSISRKSMRLVAVVLTLLLAAPAPVFAAGPQVVRNAACTANNESTGGEGGRDTSVNCDEAGAMGGFIKAADALISPAIIVMAAITPIACLVGAGAVMFGNRRGLPIIGSALGALVFVISIKGIVE